MKKIISYIFLTLTLILGCAFAVQAAETEHKPADIPGLTLTTVWIFLRKGI